MALKLQKFQHMQHLSSITILYSGGNAGLAATRAAKELDTPISVYVPMTTREVMREMLREGGASVHVHGKVR